MIRKKYISICHLSSFFLNNKKYWYSKYINFFHPIKFHPAHTKFYESIYSNQNRNESFLKKLFNYIKNSIVEIFLFQNYYIKKKKIQNCIVSNIISDEIKYNISDDLYFRGFNDKLTKSLFVYRNITAKTSQHIKKKIIQKNTIVLNKKSFFLLELYYILFVIYILVEIKIDYFKEKNKKKKNFLKEASKLINVGSAIANLRFYYKILTLVEKYKPKNIFITFEGNAWEKILLIKLRKKFKNINISGYQFAALNYDHGILQIGLKKNYYPNQILTVGKINSELLKNSKIDKSIPIKVIGTDKYNKPLSLKKFDKVCLILPGENKYEVYKFYELALKLAKKNKEFEFIFRLHPQRDATYYFKKKIDHPFNLKISNNSFNRDLKKSFFAIYGGSTAIINCLSKGLWPIYYDCNKNNVDVIFKLKLKNKSIKNVNEFKNLIKNKSFFKYNYYKVKKFYNDYYSPLQKIF